MSYEMQVMVALFCSLGVFVGVVQIFHTWGRGK